jgi:hypothetical protein
LTGAADGYKLSKNNLGIHFNKIIKTGSSVVFGVDMLREQSHKTATAAMLEGTKISYQTLHD